MKTTLMAAAAALTLAIAAPAFAGSEQPDPGTANNPVYSEQTLGEVGSNGAPTFNTNPEYGTAIQSSPYFGDLSAQHGGNN